MSRPLVLNFMWGAFLRLIEPLTSALLGHGLAVKETIDSVMIFYSNSVRIRFWQWYVPQQKAIHVPKPA